MAVRPTPLLGGKQTAVELFHNGSLLVFKEKEHTFMVRNSWNSWNSKKSANLHYTLPSVPNPGHYLHLLWPTAAGTKS